MPTIRHEEHLIQKAIVQWARVTAQGYEVRTGNLHPLGCLYAVPNGEKRPLTPVKRKDGRTVKVPLVAKRLKEEGLLAGVPDLCLPFAAQGFHALYIEVKRPGGKSNLFADKKQGGRLSESQKRIIPALESFGNCVKIVTTASGGIKVLKWYLEMK